MGNENFEKAKTSLKQQVRKSLFEKMGLKTTIMARVLRLTILMTVTVVIMQAGFYLGKTKLILNENYKNEVHNYSRATASNVEQWVNLVKQEINALTTNPQFVDESLSIEERKALLEEAVKGTEFKDFSIAYADGKTYNDTDISERDYFINAMKGTTYISSPVLRKTDNSLTIMVGAKMNVEGFDGIIYGAIDIDFFKNLLEEYDLGETGYGFILDSKGTIIAYPDQQFVQDKINPITLAESDEAYEDFAEIASDMISGKDGTDKILMQDGLKAVVGYYPVNTDEGWSVAIALGYVERNRDFANTERMSIALLTIIIIAVACISLYVAVKISYPVRVATASLKEMADGNLSVEREEVVIRSDEAGLLLTSYDDTREQLGNYISDINDVLDKITRGDLTSEITMEYKGEFAQIKSSLVKILDSLNVTFSRASAASEHLLDGASQVEAASQSLAQASTEQASAVVQITASIEGIAKSTADNTRDVIRVNELTENAKKSADEGDAQMTKMIEAMNDIDASSQSIAKIIKAIDDIAFQTNILALNASVEAARAGVHGRGFAVVADEVRTLAGKSAEASAEITGMLNDTLDKIKAGTLIASDTADDLKVIVKEIDEIAGIMENIATVAKDQAEAVEQINSGIEQISMAVQNNSATSQECAASSVELSNQAQGLANQIKFFRTR